MKNGSTTSLRSQIGSQLSGEQQVKTVQSEPKTQTSTGKVLAPMCWDAQGLLFIDYLEKRRTVNSEYYIALLVRLKEEIAKKRLQMKKKKVLFHQDNAPCHKSIATKAKLHELHFELFLHHPILQIWPSATTGCCQTSKELFRDLAPMKKWYRRQRHILMPKTNRSTKKGIELLEKR